ncbi:G2/mitotic-specific cyclin 1/2 [Cryptococcus neoformans c45]|nr:G2/mitotic-specific cyclin 1/2 [Cryptococcus neoformans var. grubii c45]
MPSGIPTRRVRLVDENAPPPPGAVVTRTRSRALASTTSTATQVKPTTTSIPMMKRQRSTISSENKIIDRPDARRNALGEVRNGKGGEKEKENGKGKAAAIGRKPLATTQAKAQRVTRSASAQPVMGVKEGDKKRKAVITSKIPSRSRSTGAEPAQVEVKPTVKTEEEPVRKRRKTSSPVVEVGEDGPTVDGNEVLLSSGGKNATAFRSPRIKAKDEGWTDLDAEDEGDPTMVSEYVVEAFKYMMDIQAQTMPDPEYMDNQAELQWKMRQILMDWIIEVHSKFRLLPETLFIATNLVDRFLSKRVISLVKFQLVGLTALFIASKYEEVCCPGVEHFLHMSDGGYTVEELLKAERYMLSTLQFDMSYPNPLNFIRRISKADGYDIQSRTVAKYLVEISCVDHRLLGYTPSMLAAASMWLARLCLERGEWNANLVHYSTYSEDEIRPCAQVMLDYILDPDFDESTSFYKKYASKKHMKASVYVREWATQLWPASADGSEAERGTELELLKMFLEDGEEENNKGSKRGMKVVDEEEEY